MPRFTYTARDRAGSAVSAELDAPSRKDALRLLAARGLQASAVAEAAAPVPKARNGKAKSAAPASASVPRGAVLLSRKQRLPFLEALHDLLTSGMSAGEAVRLLSVRIKEPGLRTLSSALWTQISEGAPLSRAMGAHPQVFDTSTVNLLAAGEATGSLNDTLARLITHLNEQRELRRQLLAALAYPVFMVFVAGGVILFFLFFLLPKLEVLLDSLGGELPTSTKLLVGLSQFAIHWGWLVALLGVFGAISFWRWRATPVGRETSDGWMLKVPLLGDYLVANTVLSFSQTLSVLLENGITAAEALRMTERQIENSVHRGAFHAATARVLEGEALSVSLTRTGCFPDLVLDRLAVGENTGNVVPSLKNIARSYQKIVTGQLNFFTKVIASAVLGLVFALVAFVAVAMVSAVFKVSGSFKMG